MYFPINFNDIFIWKQEKYYIIKNVAYLHMFNIAYLDFIVLEENFVISPHMCKIAATYIIVEWDLKEHELNLIIDFYIKTIKNIYYKKCC